MDDRIDVLATDHAPHTLEEKNNVYTKAPSGGPLVQHAIPAILEKVKEGVISIEKAVEKMSHNPAKLFQIEKRGFIKEGYFADIVIFDEDEISDASEYNQPHQYSKGIKYVWVNGALSIDQGVQNKERKGIAIRNINN